MNTIRIQLTDDNQVRVEFHGSGLIPVQEYDPTRLAELQQLFTEAVAWCARTPGEPKDVAATQEECELEPWECLTHEQAIREIARNRRLLAQVREDDPKLLEAKRIVQQAIRDMDAQLNPDA